MENPAFKKLRDDLSTTLSFNAAMASYFAIYIGLLAVLQTTTDDVLLQECSFYTEVMFFAGIAFGIAAAFGDMLFDIGRLVPALQDVNEDRLDFVCLGWKSGSNRAVEIALGIVVTFFRFVSNLTIVLVFVVTTTYNYFVDPSSEAAMMPMMPTNTTISMNATATPMDPIAPASESSSTNDCFISETRLEELLVGSIVAMGLLLIIRISLPRVKYQDQDVSSGSGG